jgi:ArsR family transcriptional regulator, arsenate/arsenite/antimonite-responsive transcriptional repressor
VSGSRCVQRRRCRQRWSTRSGASAAALLGWVYYWIKAEVLNQLGGLLLAVPQLDDDAAATRPQIAERAIHQDHLISHEADVMRLMSDPLRARIVELLADRPASTSDPVAETGAKQPNVSGHLKLLREAGMVVTEPRGPFTYYRLVPDALQVTAEQLADLAERARSSATASRDASNSAG